MPFSGEAPEQPDVFSGVTGKIPDSGSSRETIRNLQPVRYIRPDKDKLPGFQWEFRVLCAIQAENPAGTGGDIHDLIAGMCVMLHMIIRQGESIKAEIWKYREESWKISGMKKPPEYTAKRNVNISAVNCESDRCRYSIKSPYMSD